MRLTRGGVRRAVAVTALAVLLAACGTPNAQVGEHSLPSDWDAIQAAARGQTVRWWLYGGAVDLIWIVQTPERAEPGCVSSTNRE
jgi:hypothetical protein